MTSSASRIASFTSEEAEISASALSRTPGSTFPRATPTPNDCRIQATACSRTHGEISSSTVLYPPNAAAYAIPRPIVPAPITAMVLTSILCSPRDEKKKSFQKSLVGFLVKAKDHLRTANHHRSASQIWLLGHQLDGFRARRRMLLHVSRAIQLVARIQKVLVIALADQLFELRWTQPFFIQIARFEFGTEFQQETSCLAASGSSGLVQECDLHFCHLLTWD